MVPIWRMTVHESSLQRTLEHAHIAWHMTLNNHASQRPKEYGGPLVHAITKCKTYTPVEPGFASSHWDTAQNWSGLATPGMILMGLALIGGGVATTAGGVKLLRVFALYQAGLREMEKLVHPSSVSGGTTLGRRVLKGGAFIAWVFFMLFAISLALVTTVLAGLGVAFEDAMTMAVAALSTTGPLLVWAGDAPIRLQELGPAAKSVFAAAMVLGRLETLAIIALLSPGLWRS